jgi:hypothetical protein
LRIDVADHHDDHVITGLEPVIHVFKTRHRILSLILRRSLT